VGLYGSTKIHVVNFDNNNVGSDCLIDATAAGTTNDNDESRLTQTNPRDALRHIQSPIALYTQLDAQCDQQVTVVGRLVTSLGYVRRCQVLSTTDRRLSLDYRSRQQGICHD